MNCVLCEQTGERLRRGLCQACYAFERHAGNLGNYPTNPGGHPHSEASRAKIAEGNRGKQRSPEQRAKIAAARRGTVISEETRAKLSARFSGAGNPNFGKPMSEEQRRKLSGRPVSGETRARMSAAAKGRTLSPEHRAKIAEANRKRHHSPETLEKMRHPHGARVGNTLNVQGYVLVYDPGHPKASKTNGRVLEHVRVMEAHVGRSLGRGEVVHHRNHDRADNRLENLQLMSRSEHMRLHRTEQDH